MPKNNNDAYALNFFGKFMESYASARERNQDYKAKLAENEVMRKMKEEKAAADKRQQDLENRLRFGTQSREIERLGQESSYVNEKGQTVTAAPVDPEVYQAERERLRALAREYGYGDMFDPSKAKDPTQPLAPPVPAPGGLVPPATVEQQPLPPMPGQAAPPISGPPVPTVNVPKEIKKFPTFDNDGIRESAEERRAIMGLSDDYEREAKPFKESVLAYGDARSSYQRAKLAALRGESSTAADKDLVLAMIGARQGSRISDADFRLAMEQGAIDERTANYFKMAVAGRMDNSIRDQIFKLTRDAVVNREKEYSENVEKPFTEKAQFMAPGADPKFVVRPVRPSDWQKIKADYEAEYKELNPAPAATWTPDREAELIKKKAELEAIRKRKGN